MTFAFPYALILPAVYLIARLFRRRSAERSVGSPSAAFLRSLPVSTRLKLRKPTLALLEVLTVCSLALAAARPQRVTLIEQSNLARNIMLVIDASNSMSAEDFPSRFGTTSRMEGVKTVVGEYVRSRLGDRVGLIVFGNTSYLQSPLTSDMSLVEGLVELLQPRMAGDGTAIGDGLGLALKRLREVEASSKAIILITDGVNTAGQVSPLKAAQIAKELGVQVHTIGIGSGQAPIGGQGIAGIFAGQAAQMADFDETTLKEVARLTGGVYFNATSLEGFKEVYRQIDELSETEQKQPEKPLVEELFAPCALVGLMAILLSLLLNATYFRKVP
jgi:Ca-activated chloride channel family protein